MEKGAGNSQAEQSGSSSAAQPTPTQGAGEREVPKLGQWQNMNVLPKTTKMLEQWPVVKSLVNKGRESYTAVKTSSCIVTWAFNLTENMSLFLIERAGKLATPLKPAAALADTIVSERLECIEKKLPVVKESPEKVCGALCEQLSKVKTAVAARAASVINVGKDVLRALARTTVLFCRKVVKLVEKCIDQLERSFNAVTEAEGSRVAADGRLLSTARAACRAATALLHFYIGACYWLAARLPLVGRFLTDSLSPSPSQSASPTPNQGRIASSSSYESMPELEVVESAKNS